MDKLNSLNEQQREAVKKMQSFLSTPSTVTYKGKEYTIEQDLFEDNNDNYLGTLLRRVTEEEQVVIMIEYLIAQSFLLIGPAGTGKTYTSEIAVEGHKIIYSAPTFQACAVLNENTKANTVHTIASVLGTARLDKVTNKQMSDDFYLRSLTSIRDLSHKGLPIPLIFTGNTFLFDEASMIGGSNKVPTKRIIQEDKVSREVLISNDSFVALVIRLIDRWKLNGTFASKFIFLGDYAQTPPIGTEKDDDAYLIKRLMQSEEKVAKLTQIMRTDDEDIQHIVTKYRLEIDRLNDLAKQGITSDMPEAKASLAVIPYEQRVHYDNVHYYNNAADFITQFEYLYTARNQENAYNPNYVSIINFNNDVHPKTVTLVNSIRERLFGDPSVKYYEGETLLTKGNIEHSDEVTGKRVVIPKDSRVFVRKVTTAECSGILMKNLHYKFVLPQITLNYTTDGNQHTITCFAASKYLVDTLTTIRNGKRYNKGTMELTDAEAHYFGLKRSKLTYGEWLSLLSLVPDFGYAYVVNNFKIQGSSLMYSMIDEGNILSSPASPKKRIQYVYTGLTRGRKKILIMNPLNPINAGLVKIDTNDNNGNLGKDQAIEPEERAGKLFIEL